MDLVIVGWLTSSWKFKAFVERLLLALVCKSEYIPQKKTNLYLVVNKS